MKISRIVVENYRSIKKVDIEPKDFSLFVGQNNHGKTNFFEAIEWFYNSKTSSKDEHINEEDNLISVEIFFTGLVKSDLERLASDTNRTKFKKMLGENTSFSVRKTSNDHKRKFYIGGQEAKNPTGIDTAINEFLPKLEYINTKIRLDDVSRYRDKNPIGTMLSGVLATIIENSQEYVDFRKQFDNLFDGAGSQVRQELDKLGGNVQVFLQKQFPDGTKVKFCVNPPNFSDLLKSFDTTVDDGIVTKAENKGDGMQRAIMLSIIQAFAEYRKEKSGGGSFLFLIDEAELHLHPSAQRALKLALCDISTTDQVFINTHSSVLVVDELTEQIIYKVEKVDGITNIEPITKGEKINVIFDLLGGSPADLLLPRNFLIVEGKSEYTFLTEIIKRFYADEFGGIKVLFAGGDLDEQEADLLAVHRLFKPLAGSDNPIYKNKTIILIDKPNAKQTKKYKQFKEGYPYLFKNGQVFELKTETLEEYYPEGHKKNRDEVPDKKNWKVKYAFTVARAISQEQFESEMSVVFQALKAADENGFR